MPYTPEQNAKLERFWGTVESQLMAMLENKETLTLAELNDVTQAWVEQGYNNQYHSEIRCLPLERFIKDDNRHRESPDFAKLTTCFMREVSRKIRKTDGSVSLEGIRFEIPHRYHHLGKVTLRYAAFDLSVAWLVDAQADSLICRVHPTNLAANASGKRRSIDQQATPTISGQPKDEIAPYLQEMIEVQAASDMPSAWIDPQGVASE